MVWRQNQRLGAIFFKKCAAACRLARGWIVMVVRAEKPTLFGHQNPEGDFTMASYLQIAAIAAAVIVAVPFALPSSKTVTRSRFVAAAPETLFAAASSTSGYQVFNPYKDMDANLKVKPFGPEAGVGAGFAFESKDGKGTSTISAVDANKSITYQIDLGFMGKPVQVIELTPENGGTRVTWSVTSQFGLNPMGRVFGLFMDGMLGPHYELGLKNMDRISA
jgi:uncharacterized protein YndB with AHSA1/START domain